jgi:ribosomal protein L22
MSDEKDEKLENEAETPETEGAEEAKPKAEKKPGKKRRGSAETTTSTKRETVAAPRDDEGRVSVRAQAKYVRCAPRKARLVVNHIRGKSVDDARAILGATPRAASRDVLKLLDSAVANAENNHELVADELTVAKVFVDEGPTLKRFQPRAQGRATRIRKRTSHMTILLTTKEDA